MATKLLAARRAARSGATTIIMSGKYEDNLQQLAKGETVGTLLWADNETDDSKTAMVGRPFKT